MILNNKLKLEVVFWQKEITNIECNLDIKTDPAIASITFSITNLFYLFLQSLKLIRTRNSNSYR